MTDRPRRTTLLQLLLAAFFLAVIGGSVGLILGARADTGADAKAGSDSTAGPTATDTGSPRPDPGGAASPSGDGATDCPDYTVKQARYAGATGTVARVFYLRTSGSPVGSEVWICRDDAGRLFYQGHRGSPDDRPVRDGANFLFLDTVEQSQDGYVATNVTDRGTTRYVVTQDGLEIHDPSADEQQPAVEVIG